MPKIKSSVCRRLQFGKQDENDANQNGQSADIYNHLNASLEKLRMYYRAKYNFDFKEHKPLPGPYKWEATLSEARGTTIQTRRHAQSNVREVKAQPNESSTKDTFVKEQMTTPSQSSQ